MRMMRSVSTFFCGKGAATAVRVCEFVRISENPLDIDDLAGNRRGRGHRRTGEVRARLRALAADEVAVRGRDAARLRLHVVAVGAPRTSSSPASRHSKPASRKTSCRPSASASCLMRQEPGTTQALTCFATLRPRAIAAAARRSGRRELVQEPMNTRSTLVPAIGLPAAEAHVGERLGLVVRESVPSTPITSSGLVPQVICGASAEQSSTCSSSNFAPASRGQRLPVRQRLRPRARPWARGAGP